MLLLMKKSSLCSVIVTGLAYITRAFKNSGSLCQSSTFISDYEKMRGAASWHSVTKFSTDIIQQHRLIIRRTIIINI